MNKSSLSFNAEISAMVALIAARGSGDDVSLSVKYSNEHSESMTALSAHHWRISASSGEGSLVSPYHLTPEACPSDFPGSLLWPCPGVAPCGWVVVTEGVRATGSLLPLYTGTSESNATTSDTIESEYSLLDT